MRLLTSEGGGAGRRHGGGGGSLSYVNAEFLSGGFRSAVVWSACVWLLGCGGLV